MTSQDSISKSVQMAIGTENVKQFTPITIHPETQSLTAEEPIIILSERSLRRLLKGEEVGFSTYKRQSIQYLDKAEGMVDYTKRLANELAECELDNYLNSNPYFL